MAKPRKDQSPTEARPRVLTTASLPTVVAPTQRRGHDLGTTWPAWFRPNTQPALCAVNAAHLQLGLATLLVAHRLGEAIVCGHFVVDLFAYGVTDCFGESFEATEFERYLGDVDERLALESLTPEHAAAIVAVGARIGESYGIAQPETLPLWSRLLPPAHDLDSCERVVFGGPRPLAVADLTIAYRNGPRSDAAVPPLLLLDPRRDH